MYFTNTNYPDTITSVKSSWSQEFFCFISVVLTEHLFESLHVFFSFKVQHISSFTITEKENVPSLQNLLLLHG